jgi:hypothetical protein
MERLMEDRFITKNFKYSEFMCPCGCGIDRPVDSHCIYLLQSLRDYVHQPIYVTKGGGIRCPAYNKSIGGYFNSAHLFGKGADIRIPDMDIIELGKKAKEMEFNRIGFYPYDNFIHVDIMRPTPSKAWVRNKNGLYRYFRKLEEAMQYVALFMV